MMLLYDGSIGLKAALSLLDVGRCPERTLPFDFMALVKADHEPTLEEICSQASELVVERLVKGFLREKRYKLRPKRRRPWKPWWTRRPFRGRVERDAGRTGFRDLLRLAERAAHRAVAKYGPPWRAKSRGRPPLYHPLKLASILLTKHFKRG